MVSSSSPKQCMAYPSIIVRGLSLRDFIMRLRLEGVDEVRELDSILDKEDGDVVPHCKVSEGTLYRE